MKGYRSDEEVLDVIQQRGIQVFLGADRRPAVRVRGREEGRLEQKLGEPIRPVLVALTPLVFYNVTLNIEAFLVQRVQRKPILSASSQSASSR